MCLVVYLCIVVIDMAEIKDVEKKSGFLVIDGEYWEIADKDGHPIWIKGDQKKIKKRLKLIDKLASKLKTSLDREKIIREALYALDEADIKKLNKMLFKSKIRYKPRTRQHHCADMKVGNMIIPIVP